MQIDPRIHRIGALALGLGLAACSARIEPGDAARGSSGSASDGSGTGAPSDPNGEPDRGDPSPIGEPDPEPTPIATCGDDFEPVPPHVYGAKLSTLLTGRPLTAEQLATLQTDAERLRDLVDTWLRAPEAEPKLIRFFATALQQDGFEDLDFYDLLGFDRRPLGRFEDGTRVNTVLEQSFRESFARLALELFRTGEDFSQIATTPYTYMTTAQMVALAYHDDYERDDGDDTFYRTSDEIITEIVYQDRTPVPLSDSLNPDSEHFMEFYVGDRDVDLGACDGRFVRTRGRLPREAFRALNGLFTGNLGSCERRDDTTRPLLEVSDYTEYRKVRIRPPAPGEPTTKFWEIEKMRTADELVFAIPRVGFFTTPSFFATWPTNDSNQARVTTNQLLIVALGKSFDSATSFIPAFDDALDGQHADPSTSCYACHVNLDPMRQYFRNSFSYFYHVQSDDSVRQARPSFAFLGVEGAGDDVYDLAEIIASHPRFAPALMQKVCYYATSRACPEQATAFQTILDRFRQGMDFREMMVDLLSSPLVTGSRCVPEGGGDSPGIARARHLCDTWSVRTGFDNVCGRDEGLGADLSGGRRFLRQLVEVLPDDGYTRGGEEPIVITDTNLFIAGTGDAVCSRIARDVIGDDPRLDSGDPEGSIDTLLTEIMGHPEGDPRRAPLRQVLLDHFSEAEAAEGANVALQSVFLLACAAPSVTGMGL